MRMYIAGVAAALAGFVMAASPPAMASTFNGSPNTNVDWAQEFCLTDCTATMTASPITQIDVIMATPGVTFTGISSVYSDIGETSLVSSATTALGAIESTISFSTADLADLFLTLNFSPPSTSTPFTFYWEEFDGSQFITTDSSVTSSDVVSWNGSTWTITPMTVPLSATPLPAGAPLFATGLGLLAFMGYRRKRRMGLARENAYQFA
jgi:hypothetical protein